MSDPIDRAFVRLDEGLVHLRRVEGRGDGLPLLMLHASPGSSRGLEPLMAALAGQARCPLLIAPDTLGHGDSVPSRVADPEIATYAEATVRLLDRLGLEQVAVYGAHTGARIACEMAVMFPERIQQVIVDGIGEYRAELRDELVTHYAPAMAPDDYGTHLIWAFHFVRDQALHFPHYARDPAHRLMSRAVPDAEALHLAALDVLKGLRTYHHAYRAAFRYATSDRLALVTPPLTFLDSEGELANLRAAIKGFAAIRDNFRVSTVAAGLAAKAAGLLDIVSLDTVSG